MDKEQQVYALLNELGIEYTQLEHPPVHTVEDAKEYWDALPGCQCKNLFLRDAKGKEHYLVIVKGEKTVDLKAFAAENELGRLSFASAERLEKYLGLSPGAVSPFGLINDPEGCVHVLVDEDIQSEEKVCFHPNVNTATVVIGKDDFVKYLHNRKNAVRWVSL